MASNIGIVRVQHLSDHDTARRSHSGEASQEPTRSSTVGEQTEVVAEKYDGVESADSGAQLRDWQNTGVADAAQPCCPDRQWRNVNRQHRVTPFLKIESDAAGTATAVQDPPAHKAHGPPLIPRPRTVRSKVCDWPP